MASDLPISTIYVQNLEERVKLEVLTDALRAIFSEFGNVADIVARKNLNAKGQAFVVFDKVESANDAIEEVQGFELFGKPLKIALARTRSDKTVEMNCTSEELEIHRKHRQAEKDKRKALEAADEQRQLKRATGPGGDGRSSKMIRPGLKSTSVTTSSVIPDEYLPPNKILFLQNAPDDHDVDKLTTVFGQFDGFREIRLAPGRRGIAFVEYESEQGAISAKEATAGITLGDKPLKVTYQRQ